MKTISLKICLGSSYVLNDGLLTEFQHPNWTMDSRRGFPNDIALIRLTTPADLTNRFIETIPLATPSDGDFAGDECYIIGWGLTSKLRGQPY